MKSTTAKLAALSILALTTLTTGCASYQILAFQDHGAQASTTVQTLKTTKYLFWSKTEHQFWLCADEGTALNCKRECGGDTDLTCPASFVPGNSSTISAH